MGALCDFAETGRMGMESKGRISDVPVLPDKGAQKTALVSVDTLLKPVRIRYQIIKNSMGVLLMRRAPSFSTT